MKVLIVVDLQKGFLVGSCYEWFDNKIAKLIEKGSYDKIIFTKFINKQNSMYERFLGWSGLTIKDEQEIAIKVPKDCLIFEKFGYGLENKDLEKVKNLNIDKIDICGLNSDACVYAIALQLFDNGIFPNILINYVATNSGNKQAMEKIFVFNFGKVDKMLVKWDDLFF